MSSSAENSAAARGRSAVSKPLRSGVTSTSKSASSRTAPSIEKLEQPSSASSGKESESKATTAALDDNWGGFKVTKTSSETVTLNTTWKPRPPAPQQPLPAKRAPVSIKRAKAKAPPSTEDSTETDGVNHLEVAAEKNAWKYMLADIDDTFRDAEEKANKEINTRSAALSQAEQDIADKLERHDAERTLAFLEELADESLATQAPEVMIRFHAHADECTKVETEALALVGTITRPVEVSQENEDTNHNEPTKPFNDVLQHLEELHREAIALQAAFVKLTDKTEQQFSTDDDASEEDSEDEDEENARVHINAIFSSCGPVLTARIANLSLAHELVDTALQNVVLGLRMESMGIS